MYFHILIYNYDLNFFVLGNAKLKKVRGPTHMTDIWDWNNKEQVFAKLNDQHIPVGKEATK